jgi:glycosyltransferase involved in cell wall biosynthesis
MDPAETEETSAEPAVSVVVAVLNGARTIQDCIDSVVEQREVSKELILIDGGSADGTQEIIEANRRVIAHWESGADNGVYHAWNKALQHANGAWVCFLGADDRFADPYALKDLVDAGEAAGADLVCSRVCYREDDRVIGQPWEWAKMTAFMCVAHPGLLHRRALFERFGSFTEEYRIAGDYEFLLRLGSTASAAFVDRPVVDVGGSGLSSNSAATLWEARLVQSRHSEVGRLRAWRNYAMCLAERLMWLILDRLPFSIPARAPFRWAGRLLGLHRHDYQPPVRVTTPQVPEDA